MASSFSPAFTRPESSAPSGPAEPPPILVIEGLEQRLRDKERPEEFVVQVRQRLTIREGDFVALLGPSGCGKTTLLTVLGLLRSPTDPKSLKKFSMWTSAGEQRTEVDLKQAWLAGQVGRIEGMRRQHIGFALQSGELLPSLTVRENIAAPLQLNGISGAKCWERVDGLIGAFGLRRSKPAGEAAAGARIYDLSHARVNKLSGGESQRVSLARAVAHNPRLVFVDEPTAALNRELAHGALEQFRRLQTEQLGRTATIMITHDEVLAQEFANVTIRMSPLKDRPGGEVVEISYAPAALS